ncbi:transglycosylase SLT domain-containing protein [Candidatus Magnetominusculus xianensis]|uniref:transglycosylase SLT domain-containing protein n=1 Tax=Candidatus Magnetominusculus xianensis TaxID=1748249 RepID=UPI000A1198A1|nr:transglycosylase SLT domain-containing protein [Candidatus Magnetominusculus xianensis]MBF0403034.1 transglycosylase SLT domain-containing protein [Nitrospirota bacterium]
MAIVLSSVLYPSGDCFPAVEPTLVKRLCFGPPRLFAPGGKENIKKILHWKRIFSEEDIDYDTRLLKYKKNNGIELKTSYQNLIAGWHRLLEDDHLSMIHDKCQDNDVPPEIIFLALAESMWNKNAVSSSGAKGYWQFMPATAKSYGLINSRSDHRAHPELSTDAAIQLLKDNYDLTKGWDRLYKINPKTVSNNDRWLWAFWSYNSSPSTVARYYNKLRGKPANFALHSDSYENANYVNKIFGIREALRAYMKKSALRKPASPADTLYAQYLNTWFEMPMPERLTTLEEIKRQYLVQKKPHNKVPPDVLKQIWRINKILSAV